MGILTEMKPKFNVSITMEYKSVKELNADSSFAFIKAGFKIFCLYLPIIIGLFILGVILWKIGKLLFF